MIHFIHFFIVYSIDYSKDQLHLTVFVFRSFIQDNSKFAIEHQLLDSISLLTDNEKQTFYILCILSNRFKMAGPSWCPENLTPSVHFFTLSMAKQQQMTSENQTKKRWQLKFLGEDRTLSENFTLYPGKVIERSEGCL